ncbi:MAG: 4-hydroxybenzoate octaprenyltransferase [Granulosicoccus sp.]|nr:4-hydroxybenzoate octaprenyltransferase [Granulosicoccus sp.]
MSQLEKKSIAYITLIRLNRPIGIYLLLWPMLWAFWFAAGGFPDLRLLIIFILGTVLTRSAGCAINDYADRDIDAHVARSSHRPLATGAIQPVEALIVFAVLMLLAFLLVLMTDAFTIKLSFVALFLAVLYPFSKRFTYLPQIFLGAAFAWAIPMAFAAQTGELTRITWLTFIAALLWAMVYDTIYAMADRQEDLQIGVKSTAILFGEADIVIVAVIQLMVISALVLIGTGLERGLYYFSGVAVAVLLFVYQLYLIRDREPSRCIQAFLNNHYLGMAVFIGVVLDYALHVPAPAPVG